jgi:hypothetical protein
MRRRRRLLPFGLRISFFSITTQRLRIIDLATSGSTPNSFIYEWYVYAGNGCTP